MDGSSLSVVIVNYNTRDDLSACLQALAACQPHPEVVVVDNASTDGSAAMVEREFPQVKLLALDHNTWYCGGNNRGIDAAQGEYVLLLNPDTVPTPEALKAMVSFLAAHPDYLGATVQLRFPDGGIQRTCSRTPTYLYLVLNHSPLGWLFRGWKQRANARHWYEAWGRDTDADVEVIPGSCLLMRRRDLRLDDDLRLYFPEDDLARRFSGRQCRYLAGVYITHKEKGSTRTWLATRVYFRDLLVYVRKHHGMVAAGVLWLLSRPMLGGMWVKWNFRRSPQS